MGGGKLMRGWWPDESRMTAAGCTQAGVFRNSTRVNEKQIGKLNGANARSPTSALVAASYAHVRASTCVVKRYATFSSRAFRRCIRKRGVWGRVERGSESSRSDGTNWIERNRLTIPLRGVESIVDVRALIVFLPHTVNSWLGFLFCVFITTAIDAPKRERAAAAKSIDGLESIKSFAPRRQTND